MVDYHIHTMFSDGADSPRAMVMAALSEGLSELGFSDHAYTSFDRRYCLSHDGAYEREIAALKEEFAGKIRLLCGIEQDYYADFPAEGYDYVIGSVHYVKAGDGFVPVDDGNDILKTALPFYGNDPYVLAAEYFRTVGDVAEKTGADIIGHFDLIAKFNESEPLFSESDPRYVRAWQAAADRLIGAGKVFEINTSAFYRGYRKDVYPAKPIREYIRDHGGRFILTSDAHRKEDIGARFGEWGKIMKN